MASISNDSYLATLQYLINNIYFENIIKLKIYIIESVVLLKMSRYEVGVCQRFNESIHGYDETSSPSVKTHYICLFIFDFTEALYRSAKALTSYYNATIEIIETDILYPGNETIAIYKTFWLRIFQRRCRKWVENRRYARSCRLFTYLLNREYTKTYK